jgi:hypothetical protein
MGLTTTEVLALRLSALLLVGDSEHQPTTVAGIVEWFGAMQAQDLGSGLWSFGVRMPRATEAAVTDALERREAVRTWPMRGTVHFVPARDAHWMVEILGARPLAQAASRRAQIGLDAADAERAVDVLGSALSGGVRLTRAECIATLVEAGIPASAQYGYHLLWYASQRGVVCIAPNVGTAHTFALLDDWVPDPHRPDRAEALGIIALRFFRSHGPAPRGDFARWTGLTMADARTGIAAAGDALAPVETELGVMIAAAAALDAPRPDLPDLGRPLALPGFDEYILGYGDRSLVLDQGRLDDVVPGGNGVFRSTLVRRGRVVGTWTRTLRARACAVQASTWERVGAADRAGFERAFAQYGSFRGRRVAVTWDQRPS